MISSVMISWRKNVVLAPYSTFQIGGPADFFDEPENAQKFTNSILAARTKKIPVFILGAGSNTLFHDKGFRGLVIKPNFKRIRVQGDTIIAEAGALLSQLVQKAKENSLSGIEEWVGLPGTVGGAIRGNAGANSVEVQDVLTSTTIFNLEKKEKKIFTKGEMQFAYRHSVCKTNHDFIVLDGTFQLKKTSEGPEKIQAKMTSILKKRYATQPKGKSAGCIFKNPGPDISAGKLIDEAGCKGLRSGDIEISEVHGNFFINHGKGTQKDALELIKLAQKKVKKKQRVELEEEIVVVSETMLYYKK